MPDPWGQGNEYMQAITGLKKDLYGLSIDEDMGPRLNNAS